MGTVRMDRFKALKSRQGANSRMKYPMASMSITSLKRSASIHPRYKRRFQPNRRRSHPTRRGAISSTRVPHCIITRTVLKTNLIRKPHPHDKYRSRRREGCSGTPPRNFQAAIAYSGSIGHTLLLFDWRGQGGNLSFSRDRCQMQKSSGGLGNESQRSSHSLYVR